MKDSARQRPSLLRRLLWLVLCAGLGLGIGLVGFRLTANQAWFLGFPLALAIGWLFVADPTECLLPDSRTRDRSAGR